MGCDFLSDIMTLIDRAETWPSRYQWKVEKGTLTIHDQAL